jgi:membrane associated rhomboid family serine protease
MFGRLNESTTPVVKNLIILNALMMLITFVVKSSFGTDLNDILGLYYFQSPHFHPFQIVTHMFMHGGLMHIFFNMFALWMFGRVLETVWGGKRFFIFYMVTGIGAAAFYTLVNYFHFAPMIADANAFANTPSPELFAQFIKGHISNPNHAIYDFIADWGKSPNDMNYVGQAVIMVKDAVQAELNIPTVGASGAVYGVLLAFGMLFPNTELMLIFPPIPIKAKWMVIIYGAMELFFGVTGTEAGVAHFAHLGGMLFGFFLIMYWRKTNYRSF